MVVAWARTIISGGRLEASVCLFEDWCLESVSRQTIHWVIRTGSRVIVCFLPCYSCLYRDFRNWISKVPCNLIIGGSHCVTELHWLLIPWANLLFLHFRRYYRSIQYLILKHGTWYERTGHFLLRGGILKACRSMYSRTEHRLTFVVMNFPVTLPVYLFVKQHLLILELFSVCVRARCTYLQVTFAVHASSIICGGLCL